MLKCIKWKTSIRLVRAFPYEVSKWRYFKKHKREVSEGVKIVFFAGKLVISLVYTKIIEKRTSGSGVKWRPN